MWLINNDRIFIFGEILFEVKFECSFKTICVCKYTTIQNLGVSKKLITVFSKDILNGSSDTKEFYDATKIKKKLY